MSVQPIVVILVSEVLVDRTLSGSGIRIGSMCIVNIYHALRCNDDAAADDDADDVDDDE